ncbi:hypothetical protein GCM10010168_29200 [Actinoplanes ianthinogenes]|uniref:Uncharacterized protein n=1 Tax=Actinoplanes ianthinogenes TaxID=122358 RepID=A0ABM7LLD9_9ACTN|nr:hypothetical protein [Actinoplanes ianthinogenes]BCJ40062.1 hypothetical protein Aiant_07190 [Actinoplanes ianthinogenes]GGR10017.1 hypothetical protein GCM10010168_29200 [Actinoplanes ianthinogenes]
MPQRRIHAPHLGVGLRVDQAREAVHPVAADAGAVVGGPADRVLPQVHPDRQVERVPAELLQVVAELLDARLVLHRRVRVLPARRTLGRVLAVQPVHAVQVLGLAVPRFQVGVGDRPRRGDAAVVAQLAEVLRAQPEQRRAVELGVPADVVVDLGRELVTLGVEPELGRPVLALDEDGGRFPVVPLARQVTTALQDQDLLAGPGHLVGQGPAAGPGSDHDHVGVLLVGHQESSMR